MCGKFTQMYSWREVHDFLTPPAGPALDETPPAIVVTPMRFASVLILGASGTPEIAQMRWGFADRRAANPARPKHMHVRAETIDEKPTFAEAFARRRGLVVVSTFNEGEELANGKTRQWVIRPRDGRPLGIAVIWEEWRNGEEVLRTFVQVTTPANTLIGAITDRMPAILPREDWPLWLGQEAAPLAEVKALLRTFEDCGAWDMRPQTPTKGAKPTPPPRAELF